MRSLESLIPVVESLGDTWSPKITEVDNLLIELGFYRTKVNNPNVGYFIDRVLDYRELAKFREVVSS